MAGAIVSPSGRMLKNTEKRGGLTVLTKGVGGVCHLLAITDKGGKGLGQLLIITDKGGRVGPDPPNYG